MTNKLLITTLLVLLFHPIFGQKYSGGTGTKDNPYQISNLKDLVNLSESEEDWSLIFTQTCNINAKDESKNKTIEFYPIGNDKLAFSGIYDGKSKTISNLHIKNRNDLSGLFGHLKNARIHNLKLSSIELESYIYAGLLATKVINSEIINCKTQGEINGNPSSFGGLISIAKNCLIKNCSSDIKITQDYSDDDSSGNIGGIVAYAAEDTEIVNCNSSFIQDNKKLTLFANCIGGIAGSIDNSKISNCRTEGFIIGGKNIGGIAGSVKCEYPNGIQNCISDVFVNGSENVGGIAGSLSGFISKCRSTGITKQIKLVKKIKRGEYSNIGGLIGALKDGFVSDCCALGLTKGSIRIGGLIGDISNSSIQNSYCKGMVFGKEQTGGFIGGSYRFKQIYNCWFKGTVVGFTSCGGFIGSLGGENYLKRCCSFGEVYGTEEVGGFVGYDRSGGIYNKCYSICNINSAQPHKWKTSKKDNRWFGGFGGYITNAAFNQCFSKGDIIGPDCVGIFCGALSSSILADCYAFGSAKCDTKNFTLYDVADRNSYAYYPIWIDGEPSGDNTRDYNTTIIKRPKSPAVSYFRSTTFKPLSSSSHPNSSWNTKDSTSIYLSWEQLCIDTKLKDEKITFNYSFANPNTIDSIKEIGYRSCNEKCNSWDYSIINESLTEEKKSISITVQNSNSYIQAYAIDKNGLIHYSQIIKTNGNKWFSSVPIFTLLLISGLILIVAIAFLMYRKTKSSKFIKPALTLLFIFTFQQLSIAQNGDDIKKRVIRCVWEAEQQKAINLPPKMKIIENGLQLKRIQLSNLRNKPIGKDLIYGQSAKIIIGDISKLNTNKGKLHPLYQLKVLNSKKEIVYKNNENRVYTQGSYPNENYFINFCFEDPISSGESYTVLVTIWDEESLKSAELNFSVNIKPNPYISTTTEDLKYKEIAMGYYDERKHFFTLDNRIQTYAKNYIELSGLYGYRSATKGSYNLKLIFEMIDKTGNPIETIYTDKAIGQGSKTNLSIPFKYLTIENCSVKMGRLTILDNNSKRKLIVLIDFLKILK